MKACKHNDVVEYIIRRDTFERIRHVCIISDPEVRICRDCGSWLSLGHSDEAPVSVEVRAAELVADGYKRGTMVYVDESHCNHWYDDDGPCCKCGFDGDVETVCQAGYLARCIVDHNGGEE